jgi:hypothetical protein
VSTQLDIDENTVANVEVQCDLVATKWIKTLNFESGGTFEHTSITWCTVVIENNFSVEVFEIRHN